MPAFTSTSKRVKFACTTLIAAILIPAMSGLAMAADGAPLPAGVTLAQASSGQPGVPEDQDLKGTPFTEYGEFNEQDEEESVTRFLQYGRFFGVSVGGGMSTVTGNRGSVYQGGFPALELKLQYWFDFDFALELAASAASHYWDAGSRGRVDTSLLRLGLDLKYYFPVYNLAAPVTFANPFLTLGFGSIRKSDTFQAEEVIANDSSVGLSLGAGLEFVVTPRSSYFYVATKLHFVNFSDTFTTLYQTDLGLADLTGQFITTTAGFLFTW
jgi:opacity protein-like surface antigen